MNIGGVVLIVAAVVLSAGMAQAQLTRQDILDGWNANSVLMDDLNTTGDPDTGYGAVNYAYRIGKTTLTGYEFAASGIASERYGEDPGQIFEAGGGNYPAINYTFYEAAAYCNWLTSGNTNNGAYSTDLADGWGADDFNNYTGTDRNAAVAEYGRVFVVPTEDEWYKAAYYDASADTYYDWANGSNTAPIVATSTNSGGWNYNNGVGAIWPVGSGTEEQNGTYDMTGNIWERTETPHTYGGTEGAGQVMRGGTYSHDANLSGSAFKTGVLPDSWKSAQGGRIVSIPEPSSALLLGIAALGLGLLKRRR